MPTTRIQEADHRLLQELADKTGKQHQEIIHEALTSYDRQTLLDEINNGYARLRANPKEWKEELEERRAWDNSLADGIG
jgi:predicted transcriptional regulator